MMMTLIITANDEKVVFDDFVDQRNDEEYGNLWVGVCERCARKYKKVFSANRLDEAGNGCCSVLGCDNEADYYADFYDDDKTIRIEIANES